MALDSLGLGLTLDTTILEKADKTLENMHKNSMLIMQNLTRGFTAFNEGKMSDFSRVFDSMQQSIDKLKNTDVSLDFDTKGFERGIDLIGQITMSIEKMTASGTKQFFDPSNLYTTSESMKEAEDRVVRLKSELEAVHEAMRDMVDTQEELNALTAKMAEIKKQNPSTFSEDKEFMEALARAYEITEAKKAAEEKYGDMEGARMAERRLIESIEIAKKELEWTKMTKAQQMAAVVSYNQKIIADEKKRASEVESLYRSNFTKMNELFKKISQLESDRDKIAAIGGDTSEHDKNLAFLRDELNRRIKLEEEIVRSDYPKIAKIKREMETEEFVKASKERARIAEQEQRREISYASQASKNARSIEEEQEAVKLLVNARDKLSSTTAHYDRIVAALNKRIAKHEDHIKLLTHEQKESNTLMDSVISRYIREKKEIKELNKLLKELHEKQASTGVKTPEEDKYEKDIIARRQRLWNDVHQIEIDNAHHIAQLKEKYEASVAEEKIQEIIKTNEKEKQEYAKLLDDLYAIEKQKKAMEEAGGGVGDAAYDKLLQQENDLNARKSQLEAKHQRDLDEIRKKHDKRRNDDEVKAFIDAQKEKQRIAEETQRKIDEYNERYGTTSKRNAEMAITSFSGAQNINQHKQAIEGLQQVRARLDNTDKDYYETLKKLNREIHSHELFIHAAENESVRLGNSHRGLMDISGQLMRRLALVFSVSQMTQYFRKLVEVRGQFEKTEVALTSIVGSQEKSNKLMNQTIALAIKSPFTLQQLTGYTKQLAAYQVAYDQLHDTTKMLADVSAGLGVEMDRLILAFGQVKAANYLRATEVRQFTEAGFNILGELAKYYSELEGTMVSVGDVQERVTKRMVDFADVEEIFHRVTSAGGMFYDMQSRQAETLAGQWTNLQDRIDVMLNEIGTDKENILKFFVKFLASAIDNWEVLASSIKTAATAFLIFKTYSLLAGDSMKLLAIQMGVLTNSVPKVLSLGQAFKTLGKVVGSAVTKIGTAMSSLLTNPIFLAIAAIGALIGAGVSLYRHFDKMNDALKEQSNSFNEYTSSLNKLSKEYNKLDKFTEKLAKLEELKSRLNERGLNLSVKIDEVDTENIDKIFTENAEILQKSYDLGLSVGNAITRGINAAQGNIFGWSTFGENLAEDAEDFAAKWNKLASYGMDTQMRAMENEIEANEKASEAALAIYETIREGRKAERDENGRIVKYLESEYEWTLRRATKLKEIQDLEDGSVTKNKKLARYIRQVTRHEEELEHEVGNTINKLAKEFKGIENLTQAAKDNPIEFSAAIQAEVDKQAWDEVTKWVYSQKLHARLDIKPNYVESQTEEEKLAQFQQDLKDARTNLKSVKDGYQNFFISDEEIKNMKFFSDGLEGIQKLYDDNKKTIEQLDETKDSYSKEEKARLISVQAELKRVAALWNYDLDKDTGGKGRDERLERLKSQISLIKEMNKEYEKLNKTFSSSDSLEKVKKAYADTAKELDLNTSAMDFTDEGTIKSLEALLGKPEYAANKYVIELQKALDNYKVELGIEVKKETDEELKKQIEDMFDQYDLSIDLKKLNISSNAAKSLFNFDVTSLDELRKNLISMRGKFIGTDMEDEYKKYLEKISDLEDKEQKERFKKYLEFAKMSIGERAKIKMEELTKLKEIEETFRVKQGDSEDEAAYKRDMRSRATQRAKEESRNALRQLEWDEFQKTDTFTSLFDDIDNASDALITHMIDKIRDFKDEWKDMPLEDVRTMVNKLNELEVAMAERSPWEAYRNAKEAVKKAREDAKYSFESEDARDLYGKGKSDKDYIAALQIENAYQEKKVASVKEEMAIIEEMIGLKEGTLPYEVNVLDYSKQQMQYAAMTKQQLRDLLKDKKEEVNFASAIVLDNEQIIVQYKNQEKSLKKQAETLGEVQKMANDLYDAFVDLSEALGADEDSPTAIFADMGVNMMNAVLNTIMLQAQLKAVEVGAYAAGTAINSAMGIIGWIVMAIQLVAAGIKAIAKINDNKIVAQLDEQAKLIERQRDIYEQIEERVEKAYSVGQLEAYNRELEKSVDLEIQALEASIALEKSRKKADEEQINAWEEEILEARKRLAESAQEMMEEMGGIFDLTDFASGFVDAWWDAMEEGKSGLDALSEHFDETMSDMVKKQALYKGASKIMEQLQKAINAGLEEDYSIDQAEWDTIVDAANKANIDLDKFLEGYRALFGQLSLGDEGGLSGLTKGIQGVTEDTAQIIEAYLNSIRGYVSEQVTHTKNIYNLLRNVSSRDGVTALQVRMIS